MFVRLSIWMTCVWSEEYYCMCVVNELYRQFSWWQADHFQWKMEMCSSCEENPEQARLDTIPVHSIHAHATISVAHIYNSYLIERKSVWFSLYRRLQMIFSLTPVDLCCSIILPAISIIVTHCERKICWPSYIQRGIEHSTASSNPADYFPSRITWNGYNFNSIVQTAHVFVNE